MNKSFRSLLTGILAIAAVATSCQPKQTPASATATVVSAAVTSATVSLNTQGIVSCAYVVAAEGETIIEDPAVIYLEGTTLSLVNGENTVELTGLDGDATYKAAFAFKKNETSYYDRVITLDLSTVDYQEAFTLIDTYNDGFKLHVKVPQSVKDEGHAIRYAIGSLPMYLMQKSGWFATPDYDALMTNGGYYFVNDTTIVYNDDNIYEIDADGNYVLDDWTQDVIQLHTPFTPGEPIVFLGGEYAWGEFAYGYSNGYYDPCFDVDGYEESQGGGGWDLLSADVDDNGNDEDQYWTGWFCRRHFTLPQPKLLDCDMQISYNVKAVTGTIDLTPSDNIWQYCVMIMDDDSYQDLLTTYLDNNPDYLQWFTSSYVGAYIYGSTSLEGACQIVLEDEIYVQQETNYHLLIAALGDETAAYQKFWHETFSTTAKTEPAPVVEVKAISNPAGAESPYQVWYNVKCTNKNAVSGKYAANYEAEWGKMINKGYTYNTIATQGNTLTDSEIEQINSDAGLDMMFSSLPNQTTMLGIVLYNSEETCNTITADSGLASNKTIAEPAKDPVSSSLFTELLGDWTMSGNVVSYDWSQGGYADAGTQTCKVTVLDGFTYPEALTDDVYETYKSLVGMDKDAVDKLYAEFKQEVDEFNAAVKSQNRLIVSGFGFESPDAYYKYFDTTTPYDLFISDSYNGYNNQSMLWDCGPKWYIEVLADGSVVVPVNSERQYPLNYATYYTTYLAGVTAGKTSSECKYALTNTNNEDVLFPVSVASDKNSFVVNPFVYGEENYYLTTGFLSYGYFYLTTYKNVSPLTFTKGYTETAAVASSKGAAQVKPVSLGAVKGHNANYQSAAKRKTVIDVPAQVERKQVSIKPITTEGAKANAQKLYGSKR